jgi:protease-4
VQAGSETLLRAFRTAEADKSTAAIVFYVDSGGGRPCERPDLARGGPIKRSKPVIAVMGGVAASGGYYVLTHADHVIAAPSTLTARSACYRQIRT